MPSFLYFSRSTALAAELEYVVVKGREKKPEQFLGVSGRINWV
jgi:hypothetical protein